ncbi:MAG: helix-turn-helix domain-containing protein [Parachlamydiales bacterium]|jgi:excisionase family DNA binding protein
MLEEKIGETTIQIAPEVEEKNEYSITEAARRQGVTRQAIYVAIKQKKLKANKSSTRWTILRTDLDEYKKNKYSRTKSVFNGELLFDNEKGFYSINQTASILNVPAQKIYYATRTGQLKAFRKGAAWVISTADINEYKEKYLKKPFGQEAS